MTPGPAAAPPSPSEAAELAARHGLARVGTQPGFGTYLRQLWRRRAFVLELATAKAYSRNQNNYLGQLWAALNPLLLAGSYFLIFGLLLRTSDGVENYIGFLTIGIFIFSFMAAAVTGGSKAITSNQGLVRAIQFPRAALPLAVGISEILVLLPALAVLLLLLPLTGERPTWTWLLLPAAVTLTFVFCIGAALLVARAVAASRDVLNVVPLGVRLARYVSGVFFSISAYAGEGWVGAALQYQPVAVYLDLVRSCLLAESTQDPVLWAFGAGWALVFLLGGMLLFWRAEKQYGRD